MQAITVTQGSPEWATLRTQYNTASEAPAMMGVSKYQTRDELLRQKATGITPEVSQHQQTIFDRGHAAEAAARLILEEMTGEDFYPFTAVSDDGTLLASLDGITMCDSTLFEHKLYNAALAAQVRAVELEPHYYWQLEQQLLVTGAKKVIFVCSDGTRDNWAQMDYFPVPGRAAQLQAGWAQFELDRATYVPTEVTAPAPTGRAPETLPALFVTVKGEVTDSNLTEFKDVALSAIRSVNRELTTDQHFADAEKAVKWCEDIEGRVSAAKEHALSQTATIDQLFKTLDDISKEARQTRLDLAKLVTARKTSLKAELLADIQSQWMDYRLGCNKRIGRDYMPQIPVDFAGAISGKKNFDSMRSALNAALANAKIDASAVADRIQANMATLTELGSEHKFLFMDAAAIVLKANDDLTALVKTRIAEHKAAELAKEEATRARIQAEEQAKAEATARAKVLAEQEAERLAAEAAKPIPTPAAPAPQAAPAASTVRQFVAPAPRVTAAVPPSLKLGQISERLGFTVTADFLKELGFDVAAPDKSAKLYHEADFTHICAALVNHINLVQERQAA